MSLFLPFNHRPSNVLSNQSSYTCPAGKYARVTATLSVHAKGVFYATGNGSGSNFGTATSDSLSESISVWIDAGDSISKSNVTASASDTSSTANSSVTAEDTSTATFLINGANASQISCSARASGGVGSMTTGSIVATVSGSSSVTIVVEEYDIV